MSSQIKPAVFIDRDGTLIEEVNFLSRVEDLRIFDYTRPSLELLKEKGFWLVVITNQSGIGRGYYSESAMNSIHKEMQERLGGLIDGFYHCPHMPDAGCECRKPGLGMINAAKRDLAIEMKGSWVVGDKKLDVETGFNSGLRTAMVMTGYGAEHLSEMERRPDIVGSDLLSVVEELLNFRI